MYNFLIHSSLLYISFFQRRLIIYYVSILNLNKYKFGDPNPIFLFAFCFDFD
jgi:hypothetical protein